MYVLGMRISATPPLPLETIYTLAAYREYNMVFYSYPPPPPQPVVAPAAPAAPAPVKKRKLKQ